MKIAQESLELENVEWKEFKISEVFDFVMRGKRLIERDRKQGKIPYYSASKENNGLTDMISNPLFIEEDKLIISTFCSCYFIEGKFTASDEITIFGNNNLNKYNGLFIANIVKSNASKYAFGHKAFLERLIKQIIKLPVDSQNNPHWEFMESYMKQIEQKHLKTIIAYYHSKINSDSNKGGGSNNL